MVLLSGFQNVEAGTVSTQDDTWSVEEDYSPDQTYTRASDKRGHVTKFPAIVVPPGLSGYLQRAISQQRYGAAYGHVQDFLRDAIYHRIAYYEDKIGRGWIPPQVNILFAQAKAIELQSALEEQMATVEDMKNMVQTAMKVGTRGALCDASDILELGIEAVEGTGKDELIRLREELGLYLRKWVRGV